MAESGDGGGTFRAEKDSLEGGGVSHLGEKLVVAHGDCGSPALFDRIQDQRVGERFRHAEPGSDGACIAPELGFFLMAVVCPDDRSAAGGLDRYHLWLRSGDPAKLLHFTKRLPHPDQPRPAAGGVEDRDRKSTRLNSSHVSS